MIYTKHEAAILLTQFKMQQSDIKDIYIQDFGNEEIMISYTKKALLVDLIENKNELKFVPQQPLEGIITYVSYEGTVVHIDINCTANQLNINISSNNPLLNKGAVQQYLLESGIYGTFEEIKSMYTNHLSIFHQEGLEIDYDEEGFLFSLIKVADAQELINDVGVTFDELSKIHFELSCKKCKKMHPKGDTCRV